MKPVVVVLVLVLAAVLSALPAAAGCASATLSSANEADPAYRSFIWTARVFEPFYFPSYAPLDYQPPFNTSEISASFWIAGEGDPRLYYGIDNGSRVLFNAAYFSAGDLAFGSIPLYGVHFAAELNTDWNLPGVDCDLLPLGGCTCLLLNDVDSQGIHGLFALVSAVNDPAAGTFFNLAGSDPLGNAQPIVLQEIPRPVVTDVARPLPNSVEITVTVPTRSAGVYESADGTGCFCGPTNFKVRYQVLPRASVPPIGDRLPANWLLAPLPGGGAQPDNPTDGSVTLQVDCPAGDSDVYLVTELTFESGFTSPFVSGNSIRIECGGNLSGGFLLDLRNSFQPPARGGKDR